MRITDELREWAKGSTLSSWTAEHLTAIADRIDAEHERAMEERADRYAELRASLKERYIELPKDADSEYIHEHDKVDWRDHAGTWHENATVVALCNDGCYAMDGTVFHVHKSDIRHHHAPTVEDVLRELTDEVWNRCCEGATASDSGIDALVDEYAAKLRELVEDMLDCIDIQIAFERVPARWMQDEFAGRARELGIEVD